MKRLLTLSPDRDEFAVQQGKGTEAVLELLVLPCATGPFDGLGPHFERLAWLECSLSLLPSLKGLPPS